MVLLVRYPVLNYMNLRYHNMFKTPLQKYISYCMFSNRTNDMPKDKLPKLTLYTKDPCPLCDEVKLQLSPYLDKVDFEMVDITKKENVRYLRLYRYEIPVLFLNGQFLCKNKLDQVLLEERLHMLSKDN